MRAFAVVVAFCALATCASARAQEPEVRVRIEYNAPPGCPTQDAFASEVRSRNPHIHRISDDLQARTFIITIAAEAKEFHGRLSIRETNGNQEDREIAGDTCAEVSSALALITALSADATASLRDAPADAGVEPPNNVPLKPSATTTPAFLLQQKHPARDQATSSPRRTWTFDVGANAALASGVSPNALFALPIFFQANAPVVGFLAPAWRAEFLHAASGEIGFGAPTARFEWTTGALEGCPTRWRYRTLNFEPCLRAEVGILEGAGANVSPPRSAIRPWVAFGATARARWVFASPFFLEIDGALHAPVVRPAYFFEPNTPIYQPASVGGLISTGLGVRFL